MDLRACIRLCVTIVFVLVFLTSEAGADAGDVEAGVNAGAYIPFLSYSGTEKFRAAAEPAWGVGLGYDFTDQAAIEFNYLHASGSADIGGGKRVGLSFDEFMAGAAWSVLTGPVRPKFLGGFDVQLVHAGRPVRSESALGFHFGLGLAVVLKPYLHLGAAARYHYLFANRFETDNALTVLATVKFLF